MDSASQNDLKKFKDLVNEIKVATLITHSQDDGLKGRPMSTADIDEWGNLWFFTNEFSEKVAEIVKENEVILSYASGSDNSYVIIKGTSEIVNDNTKMQALWNPILKVWFPEGLSDPAIMLLKIKPDEIEFWDGSSNKAIVAFKMLKAFLSGKEYNDGEHKKISVN